MTRFLADENFHRDIVRGVRRRSPNLDIVTIQQLRLDGTPDPEVLEWADRNNRIVLSHDESTMPMYAYNRMAEGKTMRGLVIAHDYLTVASVIEDLLLMDACSDQSEWRDRVIFLPL